VSIELLLGPNSLSSCEGRGSASDSASLESSGSDGVYSRQREGVWVDEVVLLSLSTPRLITSVSASSPPDVELPLARLELLRFFLCLGPLESAFMLRGLEGVMSPPLPLPRYPFTTSPFPCLPQQRRAAAQRDLLIPTQTFQQLRLSSS
jgi:hypothetical protein